MKFYRYEYHTYAPMSDDYGYGRPLIPDVKLSLSEFSLARETPKGYWITYGSMSGLHSELIWVSKTAKKRYAYPTKEEALTNLVARTKRRIKILKAHLLESEIALDLAKKEEHRIYELDTKENG